MSDKHLKILFLSYNDKNVGGHGYWHFLHCPPTFEKKILVENSQNGNSEISFRTVSWAGKAIKARIYRRLSEFFYKVACLFHFGCIPITDNENPQYNFWGREFSEYSADIILKKLGDFTPDIISVFWTSRFLTSEIIRELHQRTGALINFVFVDQVQMTGGCHYPSDCKGFLDTCKDCPALKYGKAVAHLQFQMKKENYADLPICITGTPADIELVKSSSLFRRVKYFIPVISLPNVANYDKYLCRNKWNLPENAFVVLFGAASLKDKRKGIIYALEAISEASAQIPQIYFVCLGKEKVEDSFPPNVIVKQFGFLNNQDYFEMMTTSDCFISTTIADSGPMMVNHAIMIGVPVVSFNIGIARTLVKHGETGYIAEFKNSHSVADGIVYVYNKQKLEQNFFRNNCKELVRKLSQQTDRYDQLCTIYEDYKQRYKTDLNLSELS